MKQFLLGAVVVLALLGGAAAYVWHYQPERLPLEWRRANPQSRDYSPPVYRWRDAAGRTQITDKPPTNRPYETVRIDPRTNIVPSTLPPDSGN